MEEMQLGKFVRWGEQVTVEITRALLKTLPIAREEEIVEIPTPAPPTEEDLSARCKSY